MSSIGVATGIAQGQQVGQVPAGLRESYADDLVICCHARANEVLVTMRSMMSRLKLTLNESKTRVCRRPEETFDFLGYSVLQKRTYKEFIMN